MDTVSPLKVGIEEGKAQDKTIGKIFLIIQARQLEIMHSSFLNIQLQESI